ncbi:MAG: hypothetical protein WA110_02075 [Anaerolineaceae bacterium]
MESRRRVFLLSVSLLVVALACRFSAPTPVAWVPTATAAAFSQTQTVESLTQAAIPTTQPNLPPIPTPTKPITKPTLAEDGPWLVFPNQAGSTLYALDRDTGTLTAIALPALVDPGDLLGGRAPDGARLLVRAGTIEVLDELALYQLEDPFEPVEKVTPLLSVELQRAIIHQDGRQPPMALRAVQQPEAISWSKDGRMAIFPAALDGPSSDIYLYKPANLSIQRLDQRYQQDFSPLWSPGLQWIVFQEVDSYDTPTDWEISLVAGLNMPDNNITRYLFVPKATGLGEEFVGWTGELHLVTYTRTEQGGTTLRLSNVEVGKPRVIFTGVFQRVALDPGTGDMAVYVDPDSARQNGQTPGIYFSSNYGITFQLLLAGEYDHLSFSPEAGLFLASNSAGMLEFGENGAVLSLPEEKRISHSPNGNWIIGWGANGARLYSGDGSRLQELSTKAVEAVIWQEDSNGFYLLGQEGLYHLQFPLLQSRLLCQDVYREDETLFVWLNPQ